ncbi:MAG: DUF1566 domain-containing protein [Deltaproteobacteria bacterium]|nr:DUF1566 domain-containing protein [Deltaproteobacteria bacterium]
MKQKRIQYLFLIAALVFFCEPLAFATAPRFTVTISETDTVVIDNATELMWQQNSTGAPPLTWAAAMKHCETLTYAGHSDWRLPAINELLSIVDEKKETPPAINTVYFAAFKATHAFWSSTTKRKQSAAAYVLYFNEQNTTVGRGGVSGNVKTLASGQALCVRNAQ